MAATTGSRISVVAIVSLVLPSVVPDHYSIPTSRTISHVTDVALLQEMGRKARLIEGRRMDALVCIILATTFFCDSLKCNSKVVLRSFYLRIL